MADLKMKALEVRDEGTCIGVLAMEMLSIPGTPLEYWLGRYGYPKDAPFSIMLMMLSDGKATNDPYEWGALRMGLRTLPNAHNWIIDHWDEIADGDVIDVQVILGERTVPKISERMAHHG